MHTILVTLNWRDSSKVGTFFLEGSSRDAWSTLFQGRFSRKQYCYKQCWKPARYCSSGRSQGGERGRLLRIMSRFNVPRKVLKKVGSLGLGLVLQRRPSLSPWFWPLLSVLFFSMEGGLTNSKGTYFWGRQIPYRETMRVAGLTAAGGIALPPQRFQRISAQNLFLFRHQDQWKKWSQKEQEGIFLISCFLKLYLSICKWWTFIFSFVTFNLQVHL